MIASVQGSGKALLGGLLAATLAFAGCSAQLPDVSQFKLPKPRNFLPSNSGTYAPPVSATAFRPVVAADLVDGQGMCAETAPAAAPPQGSDANAPAAVPQPAPAVAGPVGLDMTECEVVHAIGPPQSVNMGSNERGERKVVMVYSGNERAGTYEFVAGRLTSLERGPEPPPPPKPQKPARKKKPATATEDGKQSPPT